ncbi:hypothetical protein [Methanoculleus sp.]|nr:hypothetical protein [Methanoculleus sp.]
MVQCPKTAYPADVVRHDRMVALNRSLATAMGGVAPRGKETATPDKEPLA